MAHQIRKTEYFSSNANAEVCNIAVIGVNACKCVCVCVCVCLCVGEVFLEKKWKRKELLTAQCQVFPYSCQLVKLISSINTRTSKEWY